MNYVADDVETPRHVTFAGGRTVQIITPPNGKPFLVIGRDAQHLSQQANTEDVPEWCRAAAEKICEYVNDEITGDSTVLDQDVDELAAIIARHAKEAKL